MEGIFRSQSIILHLCLSILLSFLLVKGGNNLRFKPTLSTLIKLKEIIMFLIDCQIFFLNERDDSVSFSILSHTATNAIIYTRFSYYIVLAEQKARIYLI